MDVIDSFPWSKINTFLLQIRSMRSEKEHAILKVLGGHLNNYYSLIRRSSSLSAEYISLAELALDAPLLTSRGMTRADLEKWPPVEPEPGSGPPATQRGVKPMSKTDERLEEYRKKRDFRKTGEPSRKAAKSSRKPLFVIQKHAASNLHYDFRIEVEGVLKSWAVPKGPSTDPKEKRLAMPTEDHPLEYADFEGTIPEEEYGGGTVLVWDRGTYTNLKDDISVSEALGKGHLEIWLEGQKLSGGYALIRTGRGREERWLLIKMKDEKSDARRNPVSTEQSSVLSGKSIEDIRKEKGEHGER